MSETMYANHTHDQLVTLVLALEDMGRQLVEERNSESRWACQYKAERDKFAEGYPGIAHDLEKAKSELSAACERNGNLSVQLAAMTAEREEFKQLYHKERTQRQREVGSQEYRGNTVEYIYDKCANYGKQFDAMRAELAAALDAVKRRDAILEWIAENGLPGLPECDCHECREERRNAISEKIKEN